MPNFGPGSPNNVMRPEPVPIRYGECFADEFDVSSTAAVNEADDDSTTYYDENKKRAAVEDHNPGATKKSMANHWECDQIPAALPRLPNMVLNMNSDENYRRIMKEEFKELDGIEYNVTLEKKKANEILLKLQRDHHLLDNNDSSIDDAAAMKIIRLCLRNRQTHLTRKSNKNSKKKIYLNMRDDKTYADIMTQFFRKIDGEDFADIVEETSEEALHLLREKYHIVDKDGNDVDDEDALKTLVQCLRNKYRSSKKSNEDFRVDSLTADNGIVLDMRMDKTYRDVMNKFFNDCDDVYSVTEAGKAILLELQTKLGNEGKFLKKSGHSYVEVNSESALQMIIQTLTRKSLSIPAGNKANSQHRRNSDVNRHPTENDLSEKDRLKLLDFIGRSIIVDFLKKKDHYKGWEFHCKTGLSEEWTAVKEGVAKKNAVEDETKLTGLRKIANWAYRKGYFEEYANDEFGQNMLERQGLTKESYHIIFDQDSAAESQVARAQESRARSNFNPAQANAAEANQAQAIQAQTNVAEANQAQANQEQATQNQTGSRLAGFNSFSQTLKSIRSSLRSATEKGDELGINFFGHLNEWLTRTLNGVNFVVRDFRSDNIDEAVQAFRFTMEEIELAPERAKLVDVFFGEVRQAFPLD